MAIVNQDHPGGQFKAPLLDYVCTAKVRFQASTARTLPMRQGSFEAAHIVRPVSIVEPNAMFMK